LTTLRSLRNDKSDDNVPENSKHGLQAVLGIGVFALVPMNIERKALSPFNIREGTTSMPFFTKAETKYLMQQYCVEYNVEVAEEVIETLYTYTDGYPGLWCTCANEIYKTRKGIPKFDQSHWEALLHAGSLYDTFRNTYGTTSRIWESFKKSLSPGLKQLTSELLVKQPEFIKLDYHLEEVTFLASHGVIVPIDIEQGNFCIGPQALLVCVGHAIASTRSIPRRLVSPISDNGNFDVLTTLRETLGYFDREFLRHAYSFGTKASEIVKIAGEKKVLNEAVYSFEFSTAWRSWLPMAVTITPQVECLVANTTRSRNKTKKKAADFMITCHTPNFKVIVELLANERYSHKKGSGEAESSMLGHITRTKRYADSHGILATDAWVIHFVGVETFPEEPQFPDAPECCCGYVFHLHDFTKYKIFVKLPDKTTSEFDISTKENVKAEPGVPKWNERIKTAYYLFVGDEPIYVHM